MQTQSDCHGAESSVTGKEKDNALNSQCLQSARFATLHPLFRPETVAVSVEELSPTGRVALETEAHTQSWLVPLPEAQTVDSAVTDACRSASEIRYSPDRTVVAVAGADSLRVLNSSDWEKQWEVVPQDAITALDISSETISAPSLN